jgi:DNA end-binding protein Ku
MASRSIWNGNLQVGKTSMAVKLYAAIEDEAVHFHLLHDRDEERVKQRMVNPRTGKALATDEIRKGYEVAPGTFVFITPEELAGLDAAPAREIEVRRFVPEGAVDPTWYERPYYLGPAGKSQDYFALARVLRERGSLGVARWVMRKRLYHGALRAHGEHLTLSTLHAAAEVVAAPKVEPMTRAIDARELAMAEQLVEALKGEFDPGAFEDEHRRRVLELVEAKAKGKSIELPARARKRAARPLDVALEQSLKQLRKQPVHKERKSA